MFDSPYGGPPSIYWVAAESVEEAESVARQQVRSVVGAPAAVTAQRADDVDPIEEEWPRPSLVDGIRVHTFTDSRTAYDHTQYRNDIHDGDVLFIPSENVAGFLMQAWPVAVSPNHGELHTLADPANLLIDGLDYTASARIAGTLLSGAGAPAQPVPPTPTTLTHGLVPTPGAWTVTIAGSERHDGHGPYIWVVNAPDATTAAVKAEHHHRTTEQDTDTMIRSVEPGAPGADYGWAYNDLRGIASKTIVLTPGHIRRIARIRLAYKRPHLARVSKILRPGHILLSHEHTEPDVAPYIMELVSDLMEDIGYPLWRDS